MHLVIVGGSDAATAAALRARELDPAGSVSVLVADAYPNYSICGLPYLLSGDVARPENLAHRTRAELEATGMTLLLEHRVTAIDAERRVITHAGGELAYDALIIGTGALPIQPPLPGIDLRGVYALHTMHDALALDRAITSRRPRTAAIIGAGYIGLEMAEALTQRGLRVTLIEQLPEVLPTVDRELGAFVHAELTRHGVDVITGARVSELVADGPAIRVRAEQRMQVITDVVLVVVGVRPDTALAATAGVELGRRGAICVDRTMATSVDGIRAAGDCVHTHHAILPEPTYLPLGTTAHKQGRIAAENALGHRRDYAGSLGTQIVKVFDLAIARTGLRDHEADGFEPLTVAATAPDHKPYYPGAHDIQLRVTGDRATGRLLGVQLVGHRAAEIAKRIDVPAAALHAGWTVAQLGDLDLSYTPPFGTPWDALQVAAQAWEAAAS